MDEGVTFPFVLMTNSKTVGGLPMSDVPELVSQRDRMSSLFDSWQKQAAHLVATNNDPHGNAATFLKPGNFDVIGSRIDAWAPCPLFVFMDELCSTVLGFMLMSDDLLHDDPHHYCIIVAATVNPFYYNKGVGKRMVLTWVEYQKKENDAAPMIPVHVDGYCFVFPKVDHVVLQSEQNSLTFWKKIGFVEWNTKKFKPHFDDLTAMIFSLEKT